jgi:hypothetical protein
VAAGAPGTVLDNGASDASGVVVFSGVANGAYLVIAEIAGLMWCISSQTVSGNKSATIALVGVVSPPSTCSVVGVIYDAGGDPIEGVIISARADVPSDPLLGYTMGNTAVSATTDSSGIFTLPLFAGAVVIFDCAIAGINSVKKLIPDSASEYFENLADDPT